MSRVAFAVSVSVAFACTLSFAQTPPTTQPGDVAELRVIIGMLQKQIAALKAENASLKARLASLPNQPPANAMPMSADTFTSRAKSGAVGFIEMRQAESVKVGISMAADEDRWIGDYLSTHQTSPEMARAMYAGEYKLGMPLDAAKVISCGSFTEQSRTEDSVIAKAADWSAAGGGRVAKILYFRNGLIERIETEQ